MSHLINGVDVTLTPTFPLSGMCPECGRRVENVEISYVVPAFGRTCAAVKRGDPAVARGPYFTPCGHDAA